MYDPISGCVEFDLVSQIENREQRFDDRGVEVGAGAPAQLGRGLVWCARR